jgi:outer membrane protein OmpA-like peptidoglycan-associated protein
LLVLLGLNKSNLTAQIMGIVGQAAPHMAGMTAAAHADRAGSDAHNIRLFRWRGRSVANEV